MALVITLSFTVQERGISNNSLDTRPYAPDYLKATQRTTSDLLLERNGLSPVVNAEGVEVAWVLFGGPFLKVVDTVALLGQIRIEQRRDRD